MVLLNQHGCCCQLAGHGNQATSAQMWPPWHLCKETVSEQTDSTQTNKPINQSTNQPILRSRFLTQDFTVTTLLKKSAAFYHDKKRSVTGLNHKLYESIQSPPSLIPLRSILIHLSSLSPPFSFADQKAFITAIMCAYISRISSPVIRSFWDCMVKNYTLQHCHYAISIILLLPILSLIYTQILHSAASS